MLLIIWLASILGYIGIGLLVVRRFIVKILDNPDHGNRPYSRRRDDLLDEDLLIVVFAGFLWPLAVIVYFCYLIWSMLLSMETPGEKKQRLAEEKKYSDEYGEAESSAR